MKRADWVRPLLELLEGQARRAGPNGLSTGQKALAAHLFDIMLSEVLHPLPDTYLVLSTDSSYGASWHMQLVKCLMLQMFVMGSNRFSFCLQAHLAIPPYS